MAAASAHHRSRLHATQQSPAAEDEPIYHSLDEESIIASTAAPDQLDGDVTVYINADLELVYPSLTDPELEDKGNARRVPNKQININNKVGVANKEH